jgi:hypothetical protein
MTSTSTIIEMTHDAATSRTGTIQERYTGCGPPGVT